VEWSGLKECQKCKENEIEKMRNPSSLSLHSHPVNIPSVIINLNKKTLSNNGYLSGNTY
jgi:hypothetical protein